MICSNCGYEGESKFCPKCGKPLNGGKVMAGGATNQSTTSTYQNNYLRDARRTAMTKNVLAIIGFVLSIFSLLVCFAPIAGLMIIIPAIILSILGFGALSKEGFAKTGLVMSIISLIINIIFTIVIFGRLA